MSKKLVSLLLVLMLVIGLVPAAGAAELEEANLVFYVMGNAPKDEKIVEDALNALLKEKFNATIDFQFSTWTDHTTKYNNQLTSGGADLIYIANWLNYGTLARAGAFLELDDLLNEYAPELRALAGEDMLNMCRIEGELYAVPALWPEYVSNGIKYREDLRAKYDLPVPNSIENFEAYIMGIKENEPNQGLMSILGATGSLQIGFCAFEMLNFKYPWVALNGLPYGLSANYDTPSDVFDYWNSDAFVEDCKLLKKWADLGFWSKSALSDTNDSEAYNNGLVVAEAVGQNPSKNIGSVNWFETNHPDWQSEFIAYGEVNGVIYPGHATQNGTAIVRGTKYPERAAMVLNFLMTDKEANQLVQYGVQGTHYEVNDGIYTNLSENFGNEGFSTWNLRVNEYKLSQATDIKLQEMFDKYNEIGSKTKFPNVDIYSGFVEDYSEYEFERTAVANVIVQYLAPLQAGLVEDVDAAVATFRSEVEKAGLQACRDGFTEQWLAYCEEYGYQ